MSKYSYISRDIEQELALYLSATDIQHDVILVEGARQVGKTATIRHLLRNRPHLWIDLQEDKSLVRQIDNTSKFKEFSDLLALEYRFIPSQGKILVIDEAQESEQIGGYVRYMKEKWPNQITLLLGSAMHRLFRKGIKFPVGRVRRIFIHPFSFIEFLRAMNEDYLHDKILDWNIRHPFNTTLHQKAMEYLNIYLRIGGLPTVVLDYKNKRDWQNRIVELSFDYVDDYKRVYGEEKSNLFELILRRIAETLGSPSKLTTIMASNHPGYRYLPDLMNLMENWKLIDKIELETLDAARNNRIPPKRYLFDHGIRQQFSPLTHSLTALLSQDLNKQTFLIGGIMENYVLNELRALKLRNIASWRKRPNGSEVDFLIRAVDKVVPLEVKSSLKTHQKYFSVLKSFQEYHPESNIYVLVNGDYGSLFEKNSHRFIQIPFYAVNRLLDL